MFHGQEVVLALSGIGKVAAATTTAVLMERFAIQRLVFTGVAGGLAPHVRVGDVVVATQFVQHGYWMCAPCLPAGRCPATPRRILIAMRSSPRRWRTRRRSASAPPSSGSCLCWQAMRHKSTMG